ncbi:type II secretion system F family protein [Rhodococcus chondri]|uniref:Type II secretion system F family protein n=1 Tax=Rhodococcus chondri TaxID=3065941 RepID=A0ABU7JWQ7_9NOCA|nr:type II secretion system F family protein [Rhodococcus sp. CC-R104]MEE2034459.1 type II secretion system F family protein [Rhodococcus sp. CC-R104]
MSAVVRCLAAALLTAPGPGAASRIRRHAPTSRTGMRRHHVVVVTVVAGVAGAFAIGAGAASAAAVVAATTLWRSRRRRRNARTDAERRLLLSVLETVIAALRVGAHPADACDTAADETSGAASDAFLVAAARSRLGGSAADGMRSAATTSDRHGIGASLERIADAWTVSDRYGLALADLLSAARSDLAARMRIRARTDAGLAGARATGSVLAGLPALGVGLGQLMGAAPVEVLLGDGLGAALLVAGTVLTCAGLLWTDRIAERVSS